MAAQREWFEKDYYKVLGVVPTASDKEITRAYRKLAKEHHPDANPGSEERFKEISAAYDVLGDAEKRKEYDEVRTHGPIGGFGAPGGGTNSGGINFCSNSFLIEVSQTNHAPAFFTYSNMTVLENQRQRRQQRLLAGQTEAIVGVGRVAGELAQRCRAFGMRVVGVSSLSTAPGFETLYSRARITDAAREADFMIALAAYTRENHHWSIAPLSTP